MNREQMVETAAAAIASVQRGMHVNDTGMRRRQEAAAVLEAILPQVTTVAELEALPVGTKLLAEDGSIWWSPSSPNRGWLRTTADQYDHRSLNVLSALGPLTVVWQPS